jgi:hypothetical protein
MITLMILLPQTAWAGSPVAEALKLTARTLGAKGVQTVAKESAEQAGKKLASSLAKEAAEAATRRGAQLAAMQLAKGTVSKGVQVTASSVALKADDIARLTAQMTPQNQRRLMMLLPELEASGQTAKAVSMFAKGGTVDGVMEAIWRNRGTIAVGAGLATAVVHGDDIAEAAGEHIARPAIEQVAAPVADGIKTLIVMAGVLGSMGLIIGLAYAWSMPSQKVKILGLLSRLPFVFKTTA